jgi:hypothetical protein
LLDMSCQIQSGKRNEPLAKGKKGKSKKKLYYEDNLGDKELDSGLIMDRLLELVREDIINRLNNLKSINESAEMVRVVNQKTRKERKEGS